MTRRRTRRKRANFAEKEAEDVEKGPFAQFKGLHVDSRQEA